MSFSLKGNVCLCGRQSVEYIYVHLAARGLRQTYYSHKISVFTVDSHTHIYTYFYYFLINGIQDWNSFPQPLSILRSNCCIQLPNPFPNQQVCHTLPSLTSENTTGSKNRQKPGTHGYEFRSNCSNNGLGPRRYLKNRNEECNRPLLTPKLNKLQQPEQDM